MHFCNGQKYFLITLFCFFSLFFFVNQGQAFKLSDIKKPNLGVPIPGLELTESTSLPEEYTTSGRYVTIPWINEYINGLYQFLLAIAGIVAVAVIMAGGVIYAAAGGNPNRISLGQDLIISAITGLVLLFLVYTILYLINPQIVQNEGIKVVIPEATEEDEDDIAAKVLAFDTCNEQFYDELCKECMIRILENHLYNVERNCNNRSNTTKTYCKSIRDQKDTDLRTIWTALCSKKPTREYTTVEDCTKKYDELISNLKSKGDTPEYIITEYEQKKEECINAARTLNKDPEKVVTIVDKCNDCLSVNCSKLARNFVPEYQTEEECTSEYDTLISNLESLNYDESQIADYEREKLLCIAATQRKSAVSQNCSSFCITQCTEAEFTKIFNTCADCIKTCSATFSEDHCATKTCPDKNECVNPKEQLDTCQACIDKCVAPPDPTDKWQCYNNCENSGDCLNFYIEGITT